jgi:hypothetical protein
MTKEKKTSIWVALHKAQQSVTAVGKGSKNDYHGYSYTSAEEMLTACRKALHDNGLVAYRLSWKLVQLETGSTVLSHFCVATANGTGEEDSLTAHVEYPAIPGNGRPLDKAVSAALTTSFSYWLRDLLMLPRLDDVEVDTRDDRNYNHEKNEATSLAYRIRENATNSQLEKIEASLEPMYGVKKLEEVPSATLKAMYDKIERTKGAES